MNLKFAVVVYLLVKICNTLQVFSENQLMIQALQVLLVSVCY
ncbi:hypothetical protein NSTCB13_04881 [Nostoc sp. DSM 114160]|jgi:hypothetical protein